MARPTLPKEQARNIHFAGTRFTQIERLEIHEAITRSNLSAADWVRSTLLNACRPVSTTPLPPPTPTKPPTDAKPAPTATRSRKSSGVNMGNLGNFYGA